MAMRGLIRHLDIATTAQAERSEIHVPTRERLSKNKDTHPQLRTGAKPMAARKDPGNCPEQELNPATFSILMGTISNDILMDSCA